MNDKIKQLYDVVGQEYDLGTYDEFKARLQQDDSRKKFYDVVGQEYDLGDYGSFSSIVTSYPDSASSAPSAEKVAEEMQPKDEPRFGILGKMGQYMGSPSAYVPMPQAEEIEELTQAEIDQRAAMRKMLQESGTIDRMEEMEKEARKNKFKAFGEALAYTPQVSSFGVASNIYDSTEEHLADAQRALEASEEHRQNKAMEQTLDVALDKARAGEWGGIGENNVGNGVVDFGLGLWDSATRMSTWDFGVSDTLNGLTIAQVVKKWEEDPESLTATERNLLDAMGMATAVQEAYQDQVGIGYSVGESLPVSAGFMASMYLNPASGLGKSLARKAVREYGKQSIKKNLYRIGGDFLETAIMTGTTGAGRVVADALDRINGQSTYEIDPETGLVMYGGQEDQKTVGEAVVKAIGSNFIENYSEALGEYFDPLLGMSRRLAAGGLRKMNLDKWADALSDVEPSQMAASIRSLREKAKFGGVFGEIMEEEVGMALNAITVGDYTFSKEEADASNGKKQWIFDLENQLTTALSCAIMSGAITGVETIGNVRYRREMERSVADAEKAARAAVGDEMIAQIDQASPEEMVDMLRDAYMDQNLSLQQKRTLAEYATQRVRMQYYNAADAKARRQVNVTQQNTIDAYEAGRHAQLPQYYNIDRAYRRSEAAINERENAEEIWDAIRLMNNMDENEQQNIMRDFSEEDQELIRNWRYNAYRWQGAVSHRAEQVEDLVDEYAGQVTPYTRPDGTVTTAILGDNVVYVMNEAENGDAVVYTNDGRKIFCKMRDLEHVQQHNAEELIERFRQQTTQAVEAETEKNLNYPSEVFEPAVNVEVQTADGKTWLVTAVNGDDVQVSEMVLDRKSNTWNPNGAPKNMTRTEFMDWQKAELDRKKANTYEQGDELTFYVNGEPISAEITGIDPEGNYYVHVSNLVDGLDKAVSDVYTAEELRKLTTPSSKVSEKTTENESMPIEEIKQSVSDEVANSQIEDNVTEPTAEVAESVNTALSRVPKDTKGNPLYEQTDADTAWDAIMEQTEGDVEMSQRIAEEMVADKKAALDKMQKGKPKKGATVAEKIANEKAHIAAIAQAEQEVAAWEKIAQTEARRREAAMSEADRYASEMEQKNISEGLAALGEAQSLEEYVLAQLAGGAYKLRWNDKENGTKGFGSHTGLSTEEMKARLSMVDNKNGLTPEEIAHDIVENMDASFGEVDVMDVADMVIDAVSAYESRRAMLNGLVESRAELIRQQEIAEQEAKDVWYMEQYHATEDELAAYNEYLAEFAEEIYGEDADYEQRIATFAEIQLEYDNQGTDAGLRSSADQGEGLAPDREGSSSVGETEQLNQREVLGDAAGVAASEDQGIGSSVSAQSDAERIGSIKAELGVFGADNAAEYANRLYDIYQWKSLEEANEVLRAVLRSYDRLSGQTLGVLPYLDQAQKLIKGSPNKEEVKENMRRSLLDIGYTEEDIAAAERDEQRYEADMAEDAAETVETLENGDVRRTNLNSNGEIATVAIERDGNIISVDTYEDGALFERTDYDANGNATKVTRYKDGEVVSEQEYKDGKRKVTANVFEMAEEAQKKRKSKKKSNDKLAEKNHQQKENRSETRGVGNRPQLQDASSYESFVERVAEYLQRSYKGTELSEEVAQIIRDFNKGKTIIARTEQEKALLKMLRVMTNNDIEWLLSELQTKRDALTGEERKAYDDAVTLVSRYRGRGEHNAVVRALTGANLREKLPLTKIDELFDKYNSDADVAELYRRVRAIAEQIGLDLWFDDNMVDVQAGGFRGADNRVRFNAHMLYSPFVSDQTKASVMVHEILHAVADYAIETQETIKLGLTPKVKLSKQVLNAANTILNIYEKAVKGNPLLIHEEYDNVSGEMKVVRDYGTDSAREMLMEISNPEFRDKLKQIEYNGRSVWQRIWDAIKSMFTQSSDVTNPTAYDHMAKALDVLINEFSVDAYRKYSGLEESAMELSAEENLRFRDGNNAELKEKYTDEQIFNAAKQKFGVTDDIREAGYILPDGSMLDFSGRYAVDGDASSLKGGRHMDHREVNQIAYDANDNETGLETNMTDFIERGAIRIHYSSSGVGIINLDTAPTKEQKAKLRQLISAHNGNMDVDFGNGWSTEHHAEYDNAKATRILGDIDRYYSEGVRPEGNILYRDGAPFFSNAERAVENIKQNKATPEQWLAMIKKDGGLKAGEDKWMGLSDWLNEQKEKGVKTLTKDEVLQFIRENQIEIEEVEYGGNPIGFDELKEEYEAMLHDEGYDAAHDAMIDRFGDDFDIAFEDLGGELAIANEEAAAALLRSENIINSTRLEYTTEGLDNKREIALVVPTIEPWNQSDTIHFGDAGEGRAVAWVRFGETTDEDGNRVLVIDEVQSKRHDEGRAKGYQSKEKGYLLAERDRLYDKMYRDGLTEEEFNRRNEINVRLEELGEGQIPDAPFDKNYHELAMKRMLRYAAENGFDKVAWNTGKQVAERFGVSRSVEKIQKYDENTYKVYLSNGSPYMTLEFDDDGIYRDEYDPALDGKSMSDIFGKQLSSKLQAMKEGEMLEEEGLSIGGDDRVALYDEMIPRFMNKYTKKWGTKVGEVTLPEVEEAGRTMWSVDVTPEMKESVMQGQPMFREGMGAISDREVSYENDPIAKWQGKPRYYGKRAAAFAERERARMQKGVEEAAKILGLEVEIITDASTLKGRKAKAKGWYDINSKKVVVVVPNHVSKGDAVRTVLHEGVAHHGLRELFGDGFDAMLDNIYNNVAPELKARIDAIAERTGVSTSVATEEYLASLAEDTNFEYAKRAGWWAKIKGYFMKMLRKLSMPGITLREEITDNELRYLLWRSYQNLVDPNSFLKPLGYLDDVAKQKELKVGEYAENTMATPRAADIDAIEDAEAEEMSMASEDAIRYRLVDDPAEIDRLESEPTIKAYRAMQVINGELYPPMSAVVDGKLREPIALGQWEQSEERPDLADDDGRFKLDKGNKKSLKAAYNPYFHSSSTPLNDQFSEAQDRDNLVTVEVEVPVSEAYGTSGYKAEKAKDAVGTHQWKAGIIQGQLTGTREVFLTRWDKPIRVVPESEVADVIVEMFDGKDIVMPSNVVTPQLRKELEARGITFVETDNQGKLVEGERKGEHYSKVYGKKTGGLRYREDSVSLRHISDQKASTIADMINDCFYGDVTQADRIAMVEYLQQSEDGREVIDRLYEHRGSGWARQAVNATMVRIALHDLINGREPSVQSMLTRGAEHKVVSYIRRMGEEGVWRYLEEKDFLSEAAKPLTNVNGSFLSCNPSAECAKYCYATKGHYTYAGSTVKSELVYWAVATDPNRAADRIYREYQALRESAQNKALRLFDKGDLDEAWLPVIEELNRRGIVTQIFSKRSEVLQSVDGSRNVVMLSIDHSNANLLSQYPTMPIAFVYRGKQDMSLLEQCKERFLQYGGVILPVKVGQKVLPKEELDALPSWTRPYQCPIDNGTKQIVNKENPERSWNCTKCDKNGGVGCFFKRTAKQLKDNYNESKRDGLVSRTDRDGERASARNEEGGIGRTSALHDTNGGLGESEIRGGILQTLRDGGIPDAYITPELVEALAGRIRGWNENGTRGRNIGGAESVDAQSSSTLGREDSERDRLERASGIDRNSEEIISEVEREAAALGVPVRIVRSVDELPDEDTRKRAVDGQLKGYFDPRTGEVVVYEPNTNDANDAKRTILHEIVGHKGMRQLIGEERYDKAMVQLMYMLPSEVRDAVLRRAERHGWNAAVAMDEYLADQAERDVQPTWWGRVNAKIRAILRNLGFNVMLTDADVTYLLWRSRKKLMGDTAFDMATNAILKQAARKSAEADAWNEQAFKDAEMRDFEKGAMQRLRNRIGDAQNEYDSAMKSMAFKQRESWQDSMRSLKVFMDIVSKESGKKIADFENAYMYENAMSSANLMEMQMFRHDVYGRMLKAVHELMESGAKYEEVVDYMMAKHGLERNEKMARKRAEKEAEGDAAKEAALYAKYRGEDLSGLTALTGADNVGDAEAAAMQMVSDFEAKHNTDLLWNETCACTQTILNISHDAGILSDEVYDELWNQYEYYIPLRGFDETTAEEVYTYVGDNKSPYNAPIKTAKGRKSKADDPIATIATMAESAIVEANRNRLKQRFLYMVERHRTELASVNSVWVELVEKEIKEGDEIKAVTEWVARLAEIPNDATPEEAAARQKAFERRMEKNAEENPSKFKKISEKNNIPYRVEKKPNEHEHQVIVKRNGKDVVITINGDPRVAQAINGLTNPEAAKGFDKFAGNVNRFLSANFTTRNPAFVVSNFVRDGFYTNSMVWAKESPAYAWKYNQNWVKATKLLPSLVSKYKRYEKGDKSALDMSDPVERAFYEFMINGGETGYTVINSVEDYKGIVAGDLKTMQGGVVGNTKKAVQAVGEVLDTFGRWAEDTSRFAAFLTSREMGRSVTKSIWDAKEISVNFNKKGSGRKMTQHDKGLNSILGWMSQQGRNLYVFWNAGMQGLYNFGKAVKEHPGKMAGLTGVYFGLGMAIAAIFGGHDDDEDYWNLPEYVRRNNICFRVGNKFVTLPLPIELRAIYGMGELAMSWMAGKEDPKKVGMKVVQQMSQVMPIDMMADGGGLMAFVPSWVKPIFEVGANTDWTGMPIYRERTPWNEYDPQWMLAFKSTSPGLVAASRAINEATNKNLPSGKENKYDGGWADIEYLNNPAAWEHIAEGYLGGLATMFNQTKKSAMAIWNEDLREVRNVPVVSRFLKDAGEKSEEYALREDYFNAKKVVDELRSQRGHFRKESIDPSLTEEQRKDVMESRIEMEKMANATISQWNNLENARKRLEDMVKDNPEAEVTFDGKKGNAKDALDEVTRRMVRLTEGHK